MRHKADSLVSMHHGGFDARYFRAMGRLYDPALDFSVNINPWGPSTAFLSRLRRVDYGAYPDPQNLLVREAVARAIGAAAEEILVDAGSSRILWTLVRALLSPGESAIVVDPTFGEFHRAVAAQGGVLHRVRRRDHGPRWTVDLDALSRVIEQSNARMLYLCDPNNPTGELLPQDLVPTLAHAHPECMIVWDEAYRFLTSKPYQRPTTVPPNVIRLQSLTKEQGVPGLRIGYAVMDAQLVQNLHAQRPAWCCGNAEGEGIRAALDARTDLPSALDAWFAEQEKMVEAADAAGFSVQHADAPWFLLRGLQPTAFRDAAVQDAGLLMRDCTSFGIEDAVRVCPRLPEANAHWIAWISAQNPNAWCA